MLSDYKNLERVPVNSASGELYFGERISDSLPVAIKFNVDTAAASKTRFQRENDILYDLMSHDNIIEPVSVILKETRFGKDCDFYVMKKCDTNLTDWLYLPQSGDINNKLALFKQICEGLKHAHAKGYTHRDLHTGNILVDLTPIDTAKLIDFGRAYDFNSNINLSSGSPIWGWLVMPPEVRFGVIANPETNQYEKGDIFALGLIWIFLFRKDTNPVGMLQQLDLGMHNYMDRNLALENFSSYYSTTTEQQRLNTFNSWIASNADTATNIFEIPLLDVELGTKLTNIARKLISFDPSRRYASIDDIFYDLREL